MVDATVQLYRNNFATFLMLGAVLHVPIITVQWTLLGALQPVMARGGTVAPIVTTVVLVACLIMWGTACYTVIITVVSDLYTTGTADIPSAIRRAVPRVGAAIGASFLASLRVLFGFLLFIVPGILLALGWFAIPTVTILEPLGPTAALARSSALSRGLKGHIASCFTILGLLTFAINILASLIGGGVALLLHGQVRTGLLIVQIVSAIASICLATLPPIMSTLLYYDARIRNEGYDIELMARSVGGAAAPAPAY
jgi:hypothetical protein